MIVDKYTRTFNTEFRDVEPGLDLQEDGQALVFSKVQGRTYVRPSQGVSGEIFAGISVNRNTPPKFLPKIVAGVVVPESGVVDLGRLPINGQMLVKVDGDVLDISASAPVAGKVQSVGTKLYFFAGTPESAPGAGDAVAGDQGKELFVQFMYEPLVSEAVTVRGDAPIGGLSSTERGRIAVLTRAEQVATTFYDAASDWSTALRPKLGVDGKFTMSGPGETVNTVLVLQTPVEDAASYGPLVVKITNA
uniref:Virion structural protein n=1 Tax=Pseudomonas phage HRDY3 TaxID=3236930 RepID=A0AB39CDZ9_9VIRU